MKNKGALESSRIKKAKRRKIQDKALRGANKPLDFEGIEALKVEGVLTYEVFTTNIGRIMPFILSRISEGETLKGLERLLGMNDRSLIQFFQRFPVLNVQIREARKIRVDRNHDIIDIFS